MATEAWGAPESRPPGEIGFNAPDVSNIVEDGKSLYRTIALRFFYDIDRCEDILDFVKDILGEEAVTSEGLETPGYQQSEEETGAAVRVIADALSIHIISYKETKTASKYAKFGEGGYQGRPTHFVQYSRNENANISTFKLLLEDESGRAIIEYLQNEKQRIPFLYEVMYWKDKKAPTTNERNRVRCFNSRLMDPSSRQRDGQERQKPDLTKELRSVCIFLASVEKPAQIQDAVDLIQRALCRAPGQEIPVRIAHAEARRLRRYIGADIEFRVEPASPDERKKALQNWYRNRNLKPGEILTPEAEKAALDNADGERLALCITLTVDRHLVVVLHVYALLAAPTSDTVPALSNFYRSVIFNKELLKIWYNYEVDFRALDGTIAHMFQGTPRVRSDSHRIMDLLIPSWKLTSPFFKGERPYDLTFETAIFDCPSNLHYTMRDDGRNISCPCLTSNIEISALASHITRELGWNKEGDPVLTMEVEDPIRKSVAQRFMWWQNRIGFRYQKFLQSFFLEQRVGEFLQDFKTFGEGGEQKKGEVQKGFLTRTDKQPISTYMSQRLSVAYLCGDVIGISLAVRFMTTTNNRLLLADTLLDYASMHEHSAKGITAKACPAKLSTATYTQTSRSNFPLIDDYPKVWGAPPSRTDYSLIPTKEKDVPTPDSETETQLSPLPPENKTISSRRPKKSTSTFSGIQKSKPTKWTYRTSDFFVLPPHEKPPKPEDPFTFEPLKFSIPISLTFGEVTSLDWLYSDPIWGLQAHYEGREKRNRQKHRRLSGGSWGSSLGSSPTASVGRSSGRRTVSSWSPQTPASPSPGVAWGGGSTTLGEIWEKGKVDPATPRGWRAGAGAAAGADGEQAQESTPSNEEAPKETGGGKKTRLEDIRAKSSWR